MDPGEYHKVGKSRCSQCDNINEKDTDEHMSKCEVTYD